MSILERVYDVDVELPGEGSPIKFQLEVEEYEPLYLTKSESGKAPAIDHSLLELIAYWAQEGCYIYEGETTEIICEVILSDYGLDWRYLDNDAIDGTPTGDRAKIKYKRVQ